MPRTLKDIKASLKYWFTVARFQAGARNPKNIRVYHHEKSHAPQDLRFESHRVFAKIVRGFEYVGAALFLLFAVVQYNDPDPLPWIAIYGTAALLCLAGASGRSARPWVLVYFCLALVGSAYLLRHTPGYTIHDEEFREALGLLIAATWVALPAVVRTVPFLFLRLKTEDGL